MRALVIANGEPPSAALLRELAAEADIVVAADGGAAAALAAGLAVGHVVGDFDSLEASAREAFPGARFHHDPDPDHSDIEKAVSYAIALGCDAVDVAGALGGRADHALANLSILVLYRGRAAVRILDDRFAITLVDGEATIDAPAGTVVSLVALGRCEGVTTHGLRWELRDHTLEFSPYGIHNEVVSAPARVSVSTGHLLLFTGRWVEKHL